MFDEYGIGGTFKTMVEVRNIIKMFKSRGIQVLLIKTNETEYRITLNKVWYLKNGCDGFDNYGQMKYKNNFIDFCDEFKATKEMYELSRDLYSIEPTEIVFNNTFLKLSNLDKHFLSFKQVAPLKKESRSWLLDKLNFFWKDDELNVDCLFFEHEYQSPLYLNYKHIVSIEALRPWKCDISSFNIFSSASTKGLTFNISAYPKVVERLLSLKD